MTIKFDASHFAFFSGMWFENPLNLWLYDAKNFFLEVKHCLAWLLLQLGENSARMIVVKVRLQ